MRINRSLICYLCVLFLINFCHAQNDSIYWPKINNESKTWTRWWWMGSAVDKKNLTKSMISLQKAGIGGVEIEPLYGVKGQESKFIDFLSPKWMAMLEHTLSVADSLDMGVDLTLGTGWPWGGPMITKEDASARLLVRRLSLKKGDVFSEKISGLKTGQALTLKRKDQKVLNHKETPIKLNGVYAFNEQGDFKNLSGVVKNDSLYWKAKRNDQFLYFVFEDKTEQRVKRAAPGGDGWVLDHFSKKGTENYLSTFSKKLDGLNGKIRAIFNDSYEVYGADYTLDFFNSFVKYRGYDLKPYLNRLFEDDNEISNRIRGDYRATLSDLLTQEFTTSWKRWSSRLGIKTKFQAHGSPANLIDLYASADIPECETFGSMPYNIKGFRRIPGGGKSKDYPNRNFRAGDADPIMIRFSSSAAHISGKKLVSSETFTWLREHFRTALSQCKPEAEDLFVNGINHIFLHGSTYSPDKAEWPGWKFYATVNFNSTNPIWEDAPSLFSYISRVQSMLQLGNPDNEILLFWPVHDIWGDYNNGNRLIQFEIHKLDRWLSKTPFYETAKLLKDRGYSFDYISDRFLEKANVKNNTINLPGGNYKAIVVPQSKHLPLKTLKKLVKLKSLGAKVIFLGAPQTVPGFLNFEEREIELKSLFKKNFKETIKLNNLEKSLEKFGVNKEKIVELGLKFIRRDLEGQKIYFIVNHTKNDIDEYISIETDAKGILIMNPLNGEVGKAKIKKDHNKVKIRLALESGESLLLKTYKTSDAPYWKYYHKMNQKFEITGVWDLSFIKGGPQKNFSIKLNRLRSWTELGDKAVSFSGTVAYKIKFDRPSKHEGPWQLDLGDLRDSAKIWLNNKYIGTVWSNPYKILIENLNPGKNEIKIQVTNLGSNRIKAKEARGEEWKLFYDINMVGLNYKPFDASSLDILDSGLLENPVLIPLEVIK